MQLGWLVLEKNIIWLIIFFFYTCMARSFHKHRMSLHYDERLWKQTLSLELRALVKHLQYNTIKLSILISCLICIFYYVICHHIIRSLHFVGPEHFRILFSPHSQSSHTISLTISLCNLSFSLSLTISVSLRWLQINISWCRSLSIEPPVLLQSLD